jgi:hypothetical protein
MPCTENESIKRDPEHYYKIVETTVSQNYTDSAGFVTGTFNEFMVDNPTAS